MNVPFSNGQRRAEVEAWIALVARLVAFLLGAVLLTYTVVFSTSETAAKIVFAAISAGLMGQVVASSVAQVLSALRGKRE